MPELPEVETLRRALEPRLIGRRVAAVEVRQAALRDRVDLAALQRWAVGGRITRVHRRAKYVLVDLDSGGTLILHLGMTGTLRLVSMGGGEPGHVHVVFRLLDGLELQFRDPRRFGLVAAVETASLAADPRLAPLGVEPLEDAFNLGYLYDLTRRTSASIKSVLMDGRRIAGVGNIYASEALFVAEVRPGRAGRRLGRLACQRVVVAVKQVLRESIAAGGTTLNDFRDPDGEPGYFQMQLRVYGRAGTPCGRCGGGIRRVVQAGRASFYCPGCQR